MPDLLDLRRQLLELSPHPDVDLKLHSLDRLLIAALGLHVETRAPRARSVPGDSLHLTHAVTSRSDVPVRWLSVRYPGESESVDVDLVSNEVSTRRSVRSLPEDTPLSHPHWLHDGPGEAPESASIVPLSPPAYPIQHVFVVDGQELTVEVTPEHVIRDPVRGEVRHELAVVPPIDLRFSDGVALVEPGGTTEVQVRARAARDGVKGMVRLDLPAGWSASPKSHPVDLRAEGDEAVIMFTLRAPNRTERVEVIAEATIDGEVFRTSTIEIEYEHIPRQQLLPPARLVAMSVNVEIAGRSIGYIPGAGDAVGEGLARMGFDVSYIEPASIESLHLMDFDTIVLGIRALNTRDELATRMETLFEYVRNGGTLVMQYNVSRGLITDRIAPHPLRIGRDRITDESAEFTPLAPDHRVLHHPNHITDEDFDGWIQERGLYFAEQWADEFMQILAGSDPNEEPVDGALLIAQYGDGYFVYTGLSFFRQIPAGVPGAYRLLANIVSLGG